MRKPAISVSVFNFNNVFKGDGTQTYCVSCFKIQQVVRNFIPTLLCSLYGYFSLMISIFIQNYQHELDCTILLFYKSLSRFPRFFVHKIVSNRVIYPNTWDLIGPIPYIMFLHSVVYHLIFTKNVPMVSNFGVLLTINCTFRNIDFI